MPKSRSWKSGFLKKRTLPIDLVGVNSSAADDVGKLVRVTGVLENRELRVHSFTRIASSC